MRISDWSSDVCSSDLNPENAAVAATTGLLKRLSAEELAGVMAHELAHVKNRDTLTMTITATIAGAISMLANFGLFFGDNRNNPLGIFGAILGMILAPLAARSEEHTSELQSRMRIAYADFCLNKKNRKQQDKTRRKQQTRQS